MATAPTESIRSLKPALPHLYRQSGNPDFPLPVSHQVRFPRLSQLRGLRSAPALASEDRNALRVELDDALAGCEWFTLGVMAPSPPAALSALRSCEVALGWPALLEAGQAGDPADPGSPPVSVGSCFLKGNQRTGTYLLRPEAGLGEGILISGHGAADPSAEDTWGPLPLDFFLAR